MGFLKKLGKGLKKVVKKNKGGVGRLLKKVGPGLAMAAVGATAPALLVKAASAAKSLGKKARGLETPKSMAAVVRAASIKPRKPKRTKMPGGAAMPHIPAVKVRDITPSTPQAKRSLYTSSKKSKAKKSTSGKKAPSAAQLAARAKFTAMVKARAAAKKKAA